MHLIFIQDHLTLYWLLVASKPLEELKVPLEDLKSGAKIH